MCAFWFGGYSPSLSGRVCVFSLACREGECSENISQDVMAAGNYSGITHLHDDIYAVVSDKSDSALFFKFRIQH